MNIVMSDSVNDGVLLQVFTFALACVVLAIGVLGFVLPYARPVPPAIKHAPIQAEILEVQLTRDVAPVLQRTSQPLAEPPPVQTTASAAPEVPAFTPVAEPSKVAFAIPVEGPVRVVEPRFAAPAAIKVQEQPPAAATRPAAIPQALTYGEGEGRQPAPEYPYRARREGQEGSVTIRFTVGENGAVIAADTLTPSPWPLLNEAAVKVIRDRWRFKTGALRTYDVAIRFQISK